MPNIDEVVIIDVSRWQGVMRWEVAQPLIDGAYLKATDGETWIDPQYVRNRAECTRLVIPWGAYHFLRMDQSGRKQALHFVKQIAHFDKFNGRWIIDCPLLPAVDVEHRGLLVSRDGRLAILNAFIREFKMLTGEDIVIYTGLGYWNSYMPVKCGLGQYRLWIAQYNKYALAPVIPSEWKTWVMWQWSADGNLRGPEFGATGSKSIDISRYNGGLAAFRRDYPNLAPPVVPPVEPPVDGGEEDDMRKATINVYEIQSTVNVRTEIIPSVKYGAVAGRAYPPSRVLMTLLPGGEVEALEEIKDGQNTWVRVGQRQFCAKVYDGKVFLV